MRHCYNESVEVYEVVSEQLHDALRKVADKAEEFKDNYCLVSQSYLESGEYNITLYVHG